MSAATFAFSRACAAIAAASPSPLICALASAASRDRPSFIAAATSWALTRSFSCSATELPTDCAEALVVSIYFQDGFGRAVIGRGHFIDLLRGVLRGIAENAALDRRGEACGVGQIVAVTHLRAELLLRLRERIGGRSRPVQCVGDRAAGADRRADRPERVADELRGLRQHAFRHLQKADDRRQRIYDLLGEPEGEIDRFGDLLED